MGFKYRTGDRIFGGSFVERFNPEFGGTHRIPRTGPERPRPLVRETSQSGRVYDTMPGKRHRRTMLPAKFQREDY